MKQYKKPLKFYLMVFGLTSVIILGYTIYIYMTSVDTPTFKEMSVLWIMPFFFTLIYYLGDVLSEKITKKRKKNTNNEDQFLMDISKKMTESNAFQIEEFRRLRTSEKFQTQLHYAYWIFQNGEDEAHTMDLLQKKFRKDTLEGRAMEYVVAYLLEKKQEEIATTEEKENEI